MPQALCDAVDPRILRTRQLLQDGLGNLLKKKQFDKISVQDIADSATVNRATFYDHYNDKFALLNCMVGSRFQQLLAERQVTFNGTCASAVKSLVLAVCEYLTQMQGPNGSHQLDPHMESAIIAVVRHILFEGVKQHSPENAISPEITAAAASWAIYGAVKEWAHTPDRCPPDDIGNTVVTLVSPILQLVQEERAATDADEHSASCRGARKPSKAPVGLRAGFRS